MNGDMDTAIPNQGLIFYICIIRIHQCIMIMNSFAIVANHIFLSDLNE